jgi:hypothetical protein
VIIKRHILDFKCFYRVFYFLDSLRSDFVTLFLASLKCSHKNRGCWIFEFSVNVSRHPQNLGFAPHNLLLLKHYLLSQSIKEFRIFSLSFQDVLDSFHFLLDLSLSPDLSLSLILPAALPFPQFQAFARCQLSHPSPIILRHPFLDSALLKGVEHESAHLANQGVVPSTVVLRRASAGYALLFLPH